MEFPGVQCPLANTYCLKLYSLFFLMSVLFALKELILFSIIKYANSINHVTIY